MLLQKKYTSLWLQWLNNRIPAQPVQALNIRSIFILPSGFGWGFLLVAVSLFLLGTNYQNNLMLLLSYVLLAIMLLALFHSYQNFARLALKAKTPAPVFANQAAEFILTPMPHPAYAGKSTKTCAGIVNAQWFRHPTKIAIDMDASDNIIPIPINTNKRGRYSLSRITLSSYYPLGLFCCWTHLDFAQSIVVYPEPALGEHSYINRAAPSSSESVQQGNEDFFALTDYIEGEPLNRVDWKQVAKNGNWVVKQFSEQVHHARQLTLPTNLPLEQGLSVLAFHIIDLHKKGIAYGLTLGNIEYPCAPNAAMGAAHKEQCLTALATYQPLHNLDKA